MAATAGGLSYSFYLNVIVLNNVPPPAAAPETDTDEKKTGSEKKSMLDLSIHGLSMTKKGLSERASAYVSSKTMVSRSASALTKSIPDITKSIGLDGLTIGKRFQEGTVTVLQVNMKPNEMPNYIREIRGEEAADHYLVAMDSLKALEAKDSIANLEKEMLPVVRKSLMEKLADMVVKTMKEKESGIEIECIALEEQDEARWLFTFLEFRTQMK